MTSEQRLKRVELAGWIAGRRAILAGAAGSANALRWQQVWHVLGTGGACVAGIEGRERAELK